MGIENEINGILGDALPVAEPVVDEPIAAPAEPVADSTPAEPEPTAAPDAPQEPVAEPTGEPVTPPAEPPVEPAPNQGDPRDAQIAQLNETIAALQKTINDVVVKQTQEVAPASEPAAPAAMKFVESEEALDEALKTVDNFNAMMSNAMQKMREQMTEMVQQMALQVAHGVYSQRAAADDFYRANQDLAANKAFVGMVADEIAAAHPDWDMFQVMETLGVEVRNRLKLANPNAPVVPNEPVPSNEPAPAFAGKQGARPSGGAPQLSPQQKEINALLDGFL